METTYNESLNQLVGLYKNSNFTECINYGNLLEKHYSDDLTILTILGASNSSMNNLESAAKNFKRICILEPYHFEAYNNLGKVLIDQEKYTAAIFNLKKAIQLNPNSLTAYEMLGNIYKNIGRYRTAYKYYKKIIEIDPSIIETHISLGQVSELVCDFKQAVIHYNHAVELKPVDWELRYKIANIFADTGENQNAINALDEAIKVQPNKACLYNDLGSLLALTEDYFNADKAFQKAIEIDPSAVEPYYNLAQIVIIGKEFSRSERLSRAAIKLDPNCYKAYTCLGFALFNLGKIPDAITALTTSYNLNPKYSLNLLLLFAIPQISPSCEHSKQNLFFQFKKLTEKNNTSNKTCSPKSSYKNIVALEGFGRSGSLFFHSLIDGHPNIATLPGYFFKGWFSNEAWPMLKPNFQSKDWRKSLALVIYEQFEPQFNSLSKKNVIGSPCGPKVAVGKAMGFNNLGPNSSEALVLNKEIFLKNLQALLIKYDHVDKKQVFELIHQAFDMSFRNEHNSSSRKTIFYHIHNPSPVESGNFITNYPNSKVIFLTRHPIKMLESWIAGYVIKSSNPAHRNLSLMTAYDKIKAALLQFRSPFHSVVETKGVRLEDLKRDPTTIMPKIAEWIGVPDHECLYETKFLGKLHSRPSSSHNLITGFDTSSVDIKVGRFFSERDRKILETFFWPFSTLYHYTKMDKTEFHTSLEEIEQLINEPMDFEQNFFLQKKNDLLEKIAPFDHYEPLRNLLKFMLETYKTKKSQEDIVQPLCPELIDIEV